jgi:hypothetical protein
MERYREGVVGDRGELAMAYFCSQYCALGLEKGVKGELDTANVLKGRRTSGLDVVASSREPGVLTRADVMDVSFLPLIQLPRTLWRLTHLAT